VVVASLAVGREGLETALFLWAATKAGTREAVGAVTPTWEPLLGAVLGLATAIVLGYLIYRGAIAINLTTFFTWTGAFLILVAAGVLSYGVHDLQEAGILPGLHDLAFDVSGTIDPNSWYGTLLKGIFNFSPVTTQLEAIVWVLYVVPVMFLFFHRRSTAGQTRRRAAEPSGSVAAHR
jgi:high-affinity iron transporter